MQLFGYRWLAASGRQTPIVVGHTAPADTETMQETTTGLKEGWNKSMNSGRTATKKQTTCPNLRMRQTNCCVIDRRTEPL